MRRRTPCTPASPPAPGQQKRHGPSVIRRASRSCTSRPRRTVSWSITAPADRQTSINVVSTSRSTVPGTATSHRAASAPTIGSSSTSPCSVRHPSCSSSWTDDTCVGASATTNPRDVHLARVVLDVRAGQPHLQEVAAAHIAPVRARVQVVPDGGRLNDVLDQLLLGGRVPHLRDEAHDGREAPKTLAFVQYSHRGSRCLAAAKG